MSHVATVAPVIKNLDALERACEELGLVLKRGQRTHKWYGTWVQDYNAEDAAYRICKERFEQFGTAGHAPRIRPLSMEEMALRYESGSLAPQVQS